MSAAEFSDVRLALSWDVDPIVTLLEQMHAETGIGRFDPERVRLAVNAGIARQGGVVGVVRGPDGVEATIGLFVGSNWYSPDLYIFDLWLFVGKPFRRSTHAKSLLHFAKVAATDLLLPLMITTITNDQTARKERLFERQLPRAGSIFLFNPKITTTDNQVPA